MASKSPWMSRYLPLLDLMIQRSIQFSSFGPLVELLLRKKKKLVWKLRSPSALAGHYGEHAHISCGLRKGLTFS